MGIRKYWLDDEIYVYAIDDNDQKQQHPTKTDYYIGRSHYGVLHFSFGLMDDKNYPKDEKVFIENLYNNGYFDDLIADLKDLV